MRTPPRLSSAGFTRRHASLLPAAPPERLHPACCPTLPAPPAALMHAAIENAMAHPHGFIVYTPPAALWHTAIRTETLPGAGICKVQFEHLPRALKPASVCFCCQWPP
ncbi:hypothetical protein NDU88_000116 [Pleurodeles waltl]|uniref:Uncharacterized protein n=1 Tax=Pleurodeles waltl TaxID=8319 RepID=A0AAV7S548_PLEWA|nr:hypothetical protein NDU88_000116 [Pleurodeles waltl]